MKKSYSFQELPKFLNPMAPATFLVSITANSISNLIKTTKGKERLLALAQYSAELFKLTMQDYVKKSAIQPYPVHLINAIQVEKSMKNGRKLMRVLMFTDDLGALEKMFQNRHQVGIFEIIQICFNLANIIYYILDNLVWCADIGIISKFIAHANIRWKDTKDMSSLCRCVLGLILSLITSSKTFDKIKAIKQGFISKDTNRQKYGNFEAKVIEKHKKNYLKVSQLVDSRREYRFRVLDVIINILRFCMLAQALNFPCFRKLSKIFISICGIFSTSLSIFGVLIGEQVVKVVENQTSQKKRLGTQK
jgi:Peroxisomal biogenesis factor 11 (PEX11)